MRKTVKSMIDDALAVITTYSIDEARSLHGRDDLQFIDLRDMRELEREGIIPGASHAPRGMLEFWGDPDSPYHKPPSWLGKPIETARVEARLEDLFLEVALCNPASLADFVQEDSTSWQALIQERKLSAESPRSLAQGVLPKSSCC